MTGATTYRAVGGRVAVHLPSLDLSIPHEKTLRILDSIGFTHHAPDIVGTARSRIGCSAYRRGARMREAPDTVDCSSFVKWVYGVAGILLPRRSIQQRSFGQEVLPELVRAGDLVFATGKRNYYWHDPREGVGHVGIATGDGTVIHAGRRGVTESLLAALGGDRARGVRRIIPRDGRGVVTLNCPPDLEVETSDDIRWIVLQNL